MGLHSQPAVAPGASCRCASPGAMSEPGRWVLELLSDCRELGAATCVGTTAEAVETHRAVVCSTTSY